ncbi:hypothetical protein [Salinirubrum litoreum]|uniref:Phage tail assembly chaperone protein, E, or 41 or 14 n=1 Tax=Salinirubrum litoreum TaxID=1126234 RepID=A0ABD5RE15_9EURY|nr:hypothetical protein [Salinirubrum litoreum]
MTGDTLQTEFQFTLPNGFVSEDGTLHREGTMRLATAADEILPLKDPRVRSNESYLTIILLSRVVTRLGSLPDVTPQTVENLFVADLAYLQDMYERVNDRGMDAVDATCPDCGEAFAVEIGGASASPTDSSEPPTQATETDGGTDSQTRGDSQSRSRAASRASDLPTDQPPGDDGASASADAMESPPASSGGRERRLRPPDDPTDHHPRDDTDDTDDSGGGVGNRHSPTAGSRSGDRRPAGAGRNDSQQAAGRSSTSSATTRRDDPAA